MTSLQREYINRFDTGRGLVSFEFLVPTKITLTFALLRLELDVINEQ